jgi:lysophospholipase L1-like esterase
MYGATDGPGVYQQLLDINEAVIGGGSNPITGASVTVSSHYAAMTDGSDNLAAAYDTGDGIHPNLAGRQIVADAWEVALGDAL